MQEMVLTSPKSAHKSMKEQFESVSSYIVDYLWDQPAIYCGTYKKYNEGSTMKEIRDWLNENGIKNPVGGEFTYNSVEHMLKNRRYIGELKFRDVVVPDEIPPVVPLELINDVQEKIAKNMKATARLKAENDFL